MRLFAPSPASDGTSARLRIDSQRPRFPDIRAALRARQLLVLLGRRDVTVKYRQTALGSVWIFVGPLVTSGLFSFVFGNVADLPSNGIPYFLFSYAGLLAWNLFSSLMTGAGQILNQNSGLITKIYFPRLVLPVSVLASSLINLGISFVVALGLLVAYGVGFSLKLLLLPFWLFLAVVLAIGIGLALGSVAVRYRDINYMTPILTSLLLYLTPVAYSSANVPANLRNLYMLNPLATIVEGARWSLVGTAELTAWAIPYTVVVTAGSLIVGLAVFARMEWSFADVI
jgi:lipopolysaccharide transport system permease protein